jgi:hypothetical protein
MQTADFNAFAASAAMHGTLRYAGTVTGMADGDSWPGAERRSGGLRTCAGRHLQAIRTISVRP